ADAVYAQAKAGSAEQYGMIMLKPTPYNNTYALDVSEDLADTYQLEKNSDLKAIDSEIQTGMTLALSDHEAGYIGIQSVYDLTFSNLTTMEPKLRYVALEAGEINLVDAYSTDSELEEYHLKVLEDDKSLFPPYQGAPLLREETVDEFP